MRRSHNHKHQAFLPGEFEQHLNRYALAAAAAGVGILALVQPSNAEVVYTPAHKTIAPNTTLEIDLNNDGIADFLVKNVESQSNFSTFAHMSAQPVASQNAIWGHTLSAPTRAYASALLPDALVGPKGQFLPAAGLMADTSALNGVRHKPGHPPAQASCTAPWADVADRYLGFKFIISGEVHFGWARLNVSCPKNHVEVIGVLTGYAYETVPNRPVLTGREKGPDDVDILSEENLSNTTESASLARLAQGVAGLSAWRGKP